MNAEIDAFGRSLDVLYGSCLMIGGEKGKVLKNRLATVQENAKAVISLVESLSTMAVEPSSKPANSSRSNEWLHGQAPSLVLFDMELWEIQPNGWLSDGTSCRPEVSSLQLLYPSLERIRLTQDCQDATEQLLKLGDGKLNYAAVRNHLVAIWEKLLATPDGRPDMAVFERDFMGFINEVEAALAANERTNIDGVEIFSQP